MECRRIGTFYAKDTLGQSWEPRRRVRGCTFSIFTWFCAMMLLICVNENYFLVMPIILRALVRSSLKFVEIEKKWKEPSILFYVLNKNSSFVELTFVDILKLMSFELCCSFRKSMISFYILWNMLLGGFITYSDRAASIVCIKCLKTSIISRVNWKHQNNKIYLTWPRSSLWVILTPRARESWTLLLKIMFWKLSHYPSLQRKLLKHKIEHELTRVWLFT